MAGCWQLVTVYWHACGACAFMLKGTRFMQRTVPCTLKTNALKKRVVVLIRKIILPLIFLFSKLVTYNFIPVAIYLFRRTFSSTQGIDIVLLFSIICAVVTFQHVEKCFQISVFHTLTMLTLFRKHFFNTYKRFTLPKRCVYIIASTFNSHN